MQKKFFLKSLVKYELLQNSTKQHPDTLFKYAEVCLKLGNLLLRIQDSEEAVSHYKAALNIFEYLNKINPDLYLKQETGVRYNLEIAQKQMATQAKK